MFILSISETREHAAATGGDTGRWEQAGARVMCHTAVNNQGFYQAPAY